jgi:thiol-disulfide isomerase/thioredoxin
MKGDIHAAMSLCLLASAAHAATLEWKNGETVDGGIISSTEKKLIWRVEPQRFGAPLELRPDVLRCIYFKADAHKDWSKDEITREPLSIRLDDGTRLLGAITSFDATNVTIQATRFGTVQVARSAITSLQRMSGQGLLIAGPGGRNGWKPDNETKKELWRHVPTGYISQIGWNHAARFEMKLPQRVELRVRLRSQQRPDFKLELTSEDKQRCVIETWDDEIVLHESDFSVLNTLAEDQRSVTLSLFWDRPSGWCSLFDGSGKRLTDAKIPPVESKEVKMLQGGQNPPPQGGGIIGALAGIVQMKMANARPAKAKTENAVFPGLTLKNKGQDLTIHELMLREWNGRLPDEITEVVPRVELLDGRVLKGSIVKADAKTFTVHSGESDAVLPWSQLATAHLANDNLTGTWFTKPQISLSYTDGMWARGDLVSMTQDHVELRTAFAVKPVTFQLKGAMRLEIRVAPPEGAPKTPPLAEFGRLTVGDKTLHGTMEADGGPMPRWKPIGALNSVSVLPTPDLEIHRVVSKPDKLRAEALCYFKNGDILPCNLHAMDERRLDIESPLCGTRSFKPEEVHAVHFSGEPLNASGFKDKGWRSIRGTKQQVSFADQHAEIKPGGSIAHPTFSQVSEMSFRLEGNGFTAVRVRLFTNGTDPTSRSLNLLFGQMSNETIFGIERQPDQMEDQNRVASPRSVPVRLILKDRLVEVFINGVPVRQVTVTPQMKSGVGLIIEPFSLWGNGEREIKLTHFDAKSGPGQIAMPSVDPKAREHALLIPRFRRDSPPQHVLIAGNGDLLRGVIEAATSQHFAVRSVLETIRVPADRVSAVIWLEKPDAKPAEAPPLSTHTLLLSNGGRVALNVTRFEPDAAIGNAPQLGEVKVPMNQIVTMRTTPPEENALLRSFREWRLAYAPEPVLPETGGEKSPMVTQEAPTFILPLLAGGEFDLAKQRGKVVVLDFWATWCGPCVKSLPDMIKKMSAFDSQKVRFITVNQAEPADQVKNFLETRGWKMEVALDGFQRVGQQFKVEGIPHTVIIDTYGKVAFVKTGHSPDGAAHLADQVRKLIK